MKIITKGAKMLLKEIVEHHDDNGLCDIEYWNNRFQILESDEKQEILIRDQFRILKEQGMIVVDWGDDRPSELYVLERGMSFYEEKIIGEDGDMQDTKIKVFISYNQKTGTEFVEALEKKVYGKATIVRDKNDITSWGSITEFMQSIRDKDFVVSVITEDYLKSTACMYEMILFMREKDWKHRILPAVLDASIYSKKTEYIKYWLEQKDRIEAQVKDNTDTVMIRAVATDADRIDKICAEIGDFLEFVLDSKNPSIYTVLDEIEKRVLPDSQKAIPPQFQMLTDIETVKGEIISIVLDIFLTAVEEKKGIVVIRDLEYPGYAISVDGGEERRAVNDKERAQMESSILKLIQKGLIEEPNYGSGFYLLTERGYQVGEKIIIDRMLE